MGALALGRTYEVFSQPWQTRLSPAVELAMPATVVIYDPEVSEAEYDYDTGTWVGGTVDAV